jgi:hypothetical protein
MLEFIFLARFQDKTKEEKKKKMSIRLLPYSNDSFKEPKKVNDKIIPHLDDFLVKSFPSGAENWRAFLLLLLREYILADLCIDWIFDSKKDRGLSFPSWLSQAEPDIWTTDYLDLTEEEEKLLLQSAKRKLLSIWSNLPEECKDLSFSEGMLAPLIKQIYKKGKDYWVLSGPVTGLPQFSAVIALDTKGHYAGHVYDWQDEKDKSQCAMMGIRSSVENVLNRCAKKELQKLAFHLLEGVRQHCLKKCDSKEECYLSVKAPEGPMPFFLKQAGFRPYNYLTKQYEDSLEIPKISNMYKWNFQQGNLKEKRFI